MKNAMRLFLTGFAMGSCDIVPGVSGGTIAFIFGIYEELVYSIKKVSGETLKLLLQGKITKAIASVPFFFLVPLGIGVLTAFVTLASLISYLLHNNPVSVWSFFFGLIVASIIVVRKRVVTWDGRDYAIFFAAAVISYWIVGSVPVATSATLPMFFFAGALAIVAMILPGISGSFILVLIGKYEQVLQAVVDRDVVTLGVVAIGAALGLALFSRVLSYLFEKHHDIVVAALSGFMLGSLRKVWPWKEALQTRINSHGIEVAVVERNYLPNFFTSEFLFAVALAIIAACLLLYLEKLNVVEEHVEDIEDREFEAEHKKAIKSQKH